MGERDQVFRSAHCAQSPMLPVHLRPAQTLRSRGLELVIKALLNTPSRCSLCPFSHMKKSKYVLKPSIVSEKGVGGNSRRRDPKFIVALPSSRLQAPNFFESKSNCLSNKL